MNLLYTPFTNINFQDDFFDSLKADYKEIGEWFLRKATEGSSAYVFTGDEGTGIAGFLYLKIEDGAVTDVSPPLPPGRHLKIGTMKINAHGTKLGERFVKKILDHMVLHNLDDAYVTVFEKHSGLINLFKRHGFLLHGVKHTANGTEQVLVKYLRATSGIPSQDFPCIKPAEHKKWLLAIYPQYHSLMFPDSILSNEDPRLIVRDVSYTNSIHKVYLCNMPPIAAMKQGDILVMYRTGDGQGAARFRAVATSICVVEETANINQFTNVDDFLNYCRPHSVFPESQLIEFYTKRQNPFILKFTYNIALNKRPNRGKLIDIAGINENIRWSCIELSDQEFNSIITMGEINERLIIHQA